MTQHILITNDDGIDSGFLHTLAGALAERFVVTIAAPASEQSWIGRAVSRRLPVAVHAYPNLPGPAWSIDGTPTDCVNIALGHLMETPPDAVVSGINIGYNTTIPLIYSSGTVAAALEGAFWGFPAFAISQEIPDELFGKVTENKGQLPPDWQKVLEAHAAHAAGFIARMLARSSDSAEAVVHNLNYPSQPKSPFETVLTVPARLRELPFYQRKDKDTFAFQFQHGDPVDSEETTDRQAIAAGQVSHSILNFSSLGRDLNH